MTEPTPEPPALIERQAMHAIVRDALLTHPKLTLDLDPRNIRTIATGAYSSPVMSRANMLAEKIMDRIFKDSPSISENAYNYRVQCLARPAEQAELLATFKNVMRGSPFKNATYAPDLLKGITEALTATKTNATAQEESEDKTPEELQEPIEPLPLTHESLRASIRRFFDAKQEIRHARVTSSYTVAESTVQIRVDQLTNVAMGALANEVNTLPAFKGRLTTMAKPDSKLSQAFAEYFLKNVASYSKGFYTGDAIQGYSADAKGAEYAKDLCEHLKKWVEIDHVTVAATDPKAPKAAALANELGVAQGHSKAS